MKITTTKNKTNKTKPIKNIQNYVKKLTTKNTTKQHNNYETPQQNS